MATGTAKVAGVRSRVRHLKTETVDGEVIKTYKVVKADDETVEMGMVIEHWTPKDDRPEEFERSKLMAIGVDGQEIDHGGVSTRARTAAAVRSAFIQAQG